MANVFPFRGQRYQLNSFSNLGKVLAPPYDVITPSQKKELQASSPYNVIRLILGNPSHETHKNADYSGSGKTYSAWKKSGILKRDGEPSIYIYQQSFLINKRLFKRTGFIGLSKLTPFGQKKGGILAHEHTLSGPKADRLRLMKAAHANFSCIFSLYPDKNGVGKLLANMTAHKPDTIVEFPKGVNNWVWKVSDAKWINELRKKIKNQTLFIADGHHRYETALNYQSFRSVGRKYKIGTEPFDFVMMMFVAMEDPGLVILPTHRMLPKELVKSPASLLSYISSIGEVTQYKGNLTGLGPWNWMKSLGKKKITLGLSFDGKKLYAIQFNERILQSPLLKDASAAQKKLDVTFLHSLILEPFYGITREKVEKELSFTSKAEEAVEQLRKKKFGSVFFLNPTRIEQLREVAMNRERMPQKSTYFYPKLVTGLVFNDLDSF